MKKIIITIAILAASILTFMILRPSPKKLSSSSQNTVTTSSQVTIGGKTLDELKLDNNTANTISKPRMNEQLASKISLSQISNIKRSLNQDVIVFKDGSELFITDYIKSQLPGQIRYRLEYSRESGAPTNYGN